MSMISCRVRSAQGSRAATQWLQKEKAHELDVPSVVFASLLPSDILRTLKAGKKYVQIMIRGTVEGEVGRNAIRKPVKNELICKCQ